MRIILFLFLVLLFSCSRPLTEIPSRVSHTQDTLQQQPEQKDTTVKEELAYYKEDYFRYADYKYHENVKSVQLYREGWSMAMPVIGLNSEENLILAFDVLDQKVDEFRYTLIHCDADWYPSELIPYEYLQGFEEGYVTDYRYSLNTVVPYIHYTARIPSDQMSILKSGNYVLKVYPPGQPDNPLFSRRFMVLDQKVSIEMRVKRPTSITDRNYAHEVDFQVSTSGTDIAEPYKSLRVIIQQNDRQDNAIKGLKPLLIKNDVLDYNYDLENVFKGGNEFRPFNIRSRKYSSEHVRRITFDSLYHVYLRDDKRRPFQVYQSEEDINGRYLVATEDGEDWDTESDYFLVHFSLPYKLPLANGNIYILSAFTNWQFNKENMLKYNYAARKYELQLLLKQGYYNYLYAFLEDGKDQADVGFIEGNHYETENEYSIFVYYREPGSLYDQLIGLQKTNSFNN